MNKPIVYYKDKFADIVIGAGAYVYPVNHPSAMVTNTGMVQTSTVLTYNKETGVFETRNTIYKPIEEKE